MNTNDSVNNEYADTLSRILATASKTNISNKLWSQKTGIKEYTISRIFNRKTREPDLDDLRLIDRAMYENEPLHAAIYARSPEAGGPQARGLFGEEAVRRFCAVTRELDTLLSTALRSKAQDAVTSSMVSCLRTQINATSCFLYSLAMESSGAYIIRQTAAGTSTSPAVSALSPPPIAITYSNRHLQLAAEGFLIGKKETYSATIAPRDQTSTNDSGIAENHLIAAPIRSRSGRTIAMIVCERKRNDASDDAQRTPFSVMDKEILTYAATGRLGLILETASYQRAIQSIYTAVQKPDSITGILTDIIRGVVTALGCMRGDIALWNPARNRLAFSAVAGRPTDHVAHPEDDRGASAARPLRVGDDVPIDSCINKLWCGIEHISIINDTAQLLNEDRRGYYQADDETRSEMAIRLSLGPRQIGVMNVESAVPNAFTEQDVELFSDLARYASVAIAVTWEESLITSLISGPQGGPQSQSELTALLINIVETAKVMCALTGALLYLPSEDGRRLECVIKAGAASSSTKMHSFDLDERALATFVFKNKENMYLADPHRHPEVNLRELNDFGIVGPVCALPLRIHDKNAGVLVCWSALWSSQSGAVEGRLKAIASLAAWTISTVKDQRRRMFEAMATHTPVSLFAKDRGGVFTYANASFAKYAGKSSPEDIIGKTDYDLFSKVLADKYRSDDERVMDSGEAIHCQFESHEYITNGIRNVGTAIVSKTSLRDIDNKVIGVQGMFIINDGHSTDEYQ